MTSVEQSVNRGYNQLEANGVPATSGAEHRSSAQLLPQLLSVVFVSESRAAVKAGCADGIRWRLTRHAEGEQVARELAAELSPSPPGSAHSVRSWSNA